MTNNLGVTIQFIITTWANLGKDLEAGLFDMAVGGISLTESRQQKFLVSSPIMLDGKAILANKKHYNKIKTIAEVDVPEMTVIVNRGGTNELFVKENISAAKVITTDDTMSIFNRLALGEADVSLPTD
ncbi:MAG: transporter substrate-binding protein [Gammaproteobacteria bacterium]|nr:transporter substrate-binding protein [Gammaproteobacteria bacterium]